MTEKIFKLYTNLPSFSSELIDVAKLFLVDGIFEFCDNIVDANLIHIFEPKKKGIMVNTCQYKGLVYQNQFELQKGWTELELKRYMKRFAKLSVYYCFKQIYKKQMPWGALTGIRPTKLAWELSQNGEDYAGVFKDLFDVSDKKIAVTSRILSAQEGFRSSKQNDVDIYVGIPFCTSRCSYCSFTGGELSKLFKYVDSYVDALNREVSEAIELTRVNNLKIKNVYFGGGTPTSIKTEQLESLVSKFDKINIEEFTVEAGRPDTITLETLQMLNNHKVNRISINPQTFNQHVLDAVGRKHTVEDIYDRYSMAKKFGFCVNMDFIAGLPTETLKEFKNNINKVIELSPENVTVHTLALKRGSILKEQNLPAENDGEVAKMVDYAFEKLTDADYEPYYLYRQKYMADNLENIGYCKEGKQSRYNIDIMEETTSILACGSSAVSKRVFIEQNRIERCANPKDLPTYLNNIDANLDRKRKLFE